MAKVKITGHASGTGVFTITAPNSNTDRTITLPDASVTLGTDATKLPLAGGTMTGNLDLADNVAARFGTSQDFTIKHNGSNTYLQDAGTGDLIVKSNGTDVKIIGDNDEDIAKFTWNDGVDLFFNGSRKIATTDDGVNVTGFIANATNVAKAWIKFDGGGGTIDASYNVSSLGDFGTGNYGVYIAIDITNDYSAQATTTNNKIASTNTSNAEPDGGRCDVEVNTIGGAAHDAAHVYLTIHGFDS